MAEHAVTLEGAAVSAMTDAEFRAWESEAFGYGYGTGEEHILPALKSMMDVVKHPDRAGGMHYVSQDIELRLGPAVAWLLINVCCRTDIFEYGTSPRFGWLTQRGVALRQYIAGKSAERLYEIVTTDDPADE